MYPRCVSSPELPEKSVDPYAPPYAQESALSQDLPWFRDTLMILALQIGLTISASATAWFTIQQPLYTSVFATIPAGAMLFAFLRRGRALMQVSTYRMLLALAGAIGWGTTSGLFVIWLKVVSVPGARLPTIALFIGFVVLWFYYGVATLFGLWSGSPRRKIKAKG